MQDNDDILIDDIESTFRCLYRRYRRATPVDQAAMFDAVEAAAKEWIKAQAKLVEVDERATQEHINQMRELKIRIDDAADTQELILAAGRFLDFLIKI